MPNFIDYGPIMTAEPPITCEGASLYVFGIKANQLALDHLCHRVFNQPSGGAVKCRPLGNFVILIFGAIDKVSGAVAGPGVKEDNVLLHVPVLVETPSEVFPALFSPFVWVDNPNSLTGGREVFGYAKTYGRIEIESPPEPTRFSLDTFGGNNSDSFWNLQHGAGLIHIRRGPKLEALPLSLMDLVGGADEIGALILEWSTNGVREIFFKQFRALVPGSPAPSCFAQIGVAEYILFGGIPTIKALTHLYEIRLKNLSSHPIMEQLGLPHTFESPGYQVLTNFRVTDGSVLWHG